MKKTLFILLPLVHFLRRNSTHDNANPKKWPPPWQSWTLGLAAWQWYKQLVMGCTTWHMKDFIQRLKRATKIIFLIKASILYYSLNPPNSTAPRTIKYCPPLHPPAVALPLISLASRFCLWYGWLLCFMVDRRRQILIYLFFPPIHRWPKSCNSFSPHGRCPARRLP